MQKAEKVALVYDKVLIVGVDVAKKKHFARITVPWASDVVKPFSFHDSRDGFWASSLKDRRSPGQRRGLSGGNRSD